MDPLSITTACIALLGAVGKTTQAVTSFVRTCREARNDLDAVNRELSDLRMVLDLLIEDSATKGSLPAAFEKHVLALVNNCLGVTNQITEVLQSHDGRTGPARWAMGGKEAVDQLRVLLETHRGSLNLALELANLVSSKEIKNDTAVIRNDTVDIKEDTTTLLRQISDVTVQISKIRRAVGASRSKGSTTNEVIDTWLESLTSYAESVCDDLMQDLRPAVETLPSDPDVAADTSTDDTVAFEDGGDLKVKKRHYLGYQNDIHFMTMTEHYIVGADGFSNIVLWDADTGKQLGAFNTGKHHRHDIYQIKLGFICGPEAKYVIVTQYQFGISVWDWKRGKCVFDVGVKDEMVVPFVAHEGDQRGLFWHHDNSIWKTTTLDWKKKKLKTIPGAAKINMIGVNNGLVAVLMDDGRGILLDSASGIIKATTTICTSETVRDSVTSLSVLSSDDGCRVAILMRFRPKGVLKVIFWDIDQDSVTSSDYGGFRSDTEEKVKLKWHVQWIKGGSSLYVSHDEWFDIINVTTHARRRYKTPFPRDEEVASTKEVRYGWFRRRSLTTDFKVGAQTRLGVRGGKKLIATRAPGAGIQVWEWDVEDDPFADIPGQDSESADSMGCSTLKESPNALT